jgi:hypothetical protein
MENFKLSPTNYEAARIVGSIILEFCANYPCDTKSRWKQTQILVAVNSHDPVYSEVNFLGELRSKVDWNYVRSILVNQEGGHQVGKKLFPAHRISKEYALEETLKYFDKNSQLIKMDELVNFRDKCFKLYDEIWEKVEKIRGEDDQQVKFFNFFKEFYGKSFDQFYQCQKLVRPANINEDERRLWFFTYLQAFGHLEKNDFYYNCPAKAWSYSPKKDDGQYLNDQNKEFNKCRAGNFEKMFDQAINGISLMRNQTNKNYRFIEYDTRRGGSHQKIYGWVEGTNLTFTCKDSKDAIKENQFDLFPQDVVWNNFLSKMVEDEKTIK